MTSPEPRWDPCTPGFVIAGLRIMVGLWIIASLGSLLFYHAGWLGVMTGGIIALCAYAVAILTGRVMSGTGRYGCALFALLALQAVVWVGMIVLLAGAKVNPLGFILGASILPVALLLTLAWYAMMKWHAASKEKGSPS